MRSVYLALGATLLSGCMLGPNFVASDVKAPKSWRQSQATSRTVNQSINPEWWNIFHDPTLTELISRASAANFDLRVASTRVAQARAERQIIGGDSLPAVNGSASYQRARNSAKGLQDSSGFDGEKAFSVWQADSDVSWEWDLWGRVRRELESADANVDAHTDLLRGVLLSVQAETAGDYIQLRAVQAQRATAEQNLAVAEHSLKLTSVRMNDGVATQLEVAEALAQVASVQADYRFCNSSSRT